MPSSALDIYIGKRLRRRRKLLGLSQQKLGAAAGCTFQQIQKYESAASRVLAARLYDLAAALTVPVTYFFEGYNATSTSKSESPTQCSNPSKP